MSLQLCRGVPAVIDADTVLGIYMLDVPCRDDDICENITLSLMLGTKTV